MRNNKGEKKNSIKGVIVLPLTLLIGGIVLETTIAATLVAFYILQGGVGTRNAADALMVARSGISDAAIRLARDMNFDGSYTIYMESQRTAQVTVCNKGQKTTGCGTAGGCDYAVPLDKAEITVLGTVSGRNRCMRAVYAIHSETGEMKIESSEEIAL